jgi:hydroxymethylglutaryl-CoA synthase
VFDSKVLTMVGIVSYGVYVPKWRIKADEIAQLWGHDAESYKQGLLVEEKSVPSLDEDTTTIAVQAARDALRRAPEVDPQEIGALYVGSESHPYAVKPTAATVAEAIGATPSLTAADLEFACKAGTAGIQACMGLVKAGYVKYGMSIGSDTAQSQPGDALEYTAAAGAAAYLIGQDRTLAEIEETYSYTQDVPDFWRREGAEYPQHGGKFTGEPGYFTQVLNCARGLMKKAGTTPDDYNYAVFHQPNGKFPLRAAQILGFPEAKVMPGLVVTKIGNTYSGSSMLGLAAVLDQAKPGDRIMVTSYGSGAGSDGFSIRVNDEIMTKKGLAPPVSFYVNRKEYINYSRYSKFRRMIKGVSD